jgi:hypothetical protein
VTGVPGPVLFARYAYPPNALGYCGPADHPALLAYGATGVVDGGLRDLARGFEGAWPYLELIAAANGIADPLDERVVAAYWIGNPLLDHVGPRRFSASLEPRFRLRAGRTWDRLTEPLAAGGVPHHSFHVFAVYPWVGLMRTGSIDEPLRVIDRCRIRWGRVEGVVGDEVIVRSRPLAWRGGQLVLDEPRIERVRGAVAGSGFVRASVGAAVALHWDWLCDVLTPAAQERLVAYTARHLAIVNGVAHPAPAAVLA